VKLDLPLPGESLVEQISRYSKQRYSFVDLDVAKSRAGAMGQRVLRKMKGYTEARQVQSGARNGTATLTPQQRRSVESLA